MRSLVEGIFRQIPGYARFSLLKECLSVDDRFAVFWADGPGLGVEGTYAVGGRCPILPIYGARKSVVDAVADYVELLDKHADSILNNNGQAGWPLPYDPKTLREVQPCYELAMYLYRTTLWVREEVLDRL